MRGVEYRFRTLRGIDKCVAHDSYLVKDAESGEDVIQVIMHDVTERKHAEEQLEHVLTGARCILWHAIVTPKKRGDFKWDIVVSNEPAAEKLLPLNPVDEATLAELHHKSHENCFIANSVTTNVTVEPRN